MTVPRWLVATAVVAAIAGYVAWSAGGSGVLGVAGAILFWLAAMVLAAHAVQRGVERRRGRDGP